VKPPLAVGCLAALLLAGPSLAGTSRLHADQAGAQGEAKKAGESAKKAGKNIGDAAKHFGRAVAKGAKKVGEKAKKAAHLPDLRGPYGATRVRARFALLESSKRAGGLRSLAGRSGGVASAKPAVGRLDEHALRQ
jgi:hypothetical protein